MGENVGLADARPEAAALPVARRVFRNPFRAVAYGLMLCSGVLYVGGALAYLASDFARDSPSNGEVHNAASALLLGSLAAYFVVATAVLILVVVQLDRRILRATWLVLSWIAALVPIALAAQVYGSWWFVHPEVVDPPGSVGFVAACVSAVTLVPSIAALTIAELRERSENQYPTLAGVYTTAGLSGLLAAVLILVSLRPLGAVDVVELGAPMEMGPPASELDVSRVQDVHGIYNGRTVLTAAGVIVAKDGEVRSYDTFGGPERWRVSKPGMSVNVGDVNTYEDGSVVVVKWEPVGLGGLTEAYSADTGKLLWDNNSQDSDRKIAGERPGMNYVDARTGAIAWSLDTEEVCGSSRLIRESGFDGVIPFTSVDDNGIVHRIGGIDLASGVIRWSRESTRRIGDPAPVVNVLDGDVVTSYELSSGKLLGTSSRNRPGVRNEFVLSNGWQIVTTEGDAGKLSLTGLDANGAQQWSVNQSWIGSVDYLTSVGGTAIFMAFGSGSAWVVAVDARTGGLKVLVGPGVAPDGQVPPILSAEMADRELFFDYDPASATLVSGGLLLEFHFRQFSAPDLWIPAA